MITNADITIYNHRIDPATRQTAYARHVVQDVSWYASINVSAASGGLAGGDVYKTVSYTHLDVYKRQVLKELAQIILRLGRTLGNAVDPDTEITIDFDDSIIEDKQSERQQDRQDVAMGAMTLLDYRMKWYQEDAEEAAKHIASDEMCIRDRIMRSF